MATYLSPDVYIREVSSGARPIEAVGTSTAAFIGVSMKKDKTLFNQAIPISNWREFVNKFVGNVSEGAKTTHLVHAVWGFFQNGGSRCYIVDCGDDIRPALETLETEDEVRLVAAPGYIDASSYDALLTHCENMGDRFAILDGPPRAQKVSSLAEQKVPDKPAPDDKKKESGLGPRRSDRGFGAFYYPWIEVKDPLGLAEATVPVPPSGHIAGVYARTDARRGVHKAPANEVIKGALNVTHRLTRADQDELNPKGINCIRFFSSEGVLLWGARGLTKTASSEWRYVNVRRLFNMIEESIARSTRWIVFEPNDESLWKAIRRDITAFLTLIWRSGALMGKTPEEAFFVKCDEETNTPEVIDAGQVVTQIGIAPVKPAEFIIFEIGQYAGGTQVEE